MKKHQNKQLQRTSTEQGMALIASMMCLLLCTGLGVAVLMNSTGEAALSGGFRRNEQAFYAADAGLGIARMAIRNSLNTAIQAAAVPTEAAPSLGTRTAGTFTLRTYNRTQLGNILQSASLLAQDGAPIVNAKTAIASRATALTNAGFEIDVQLTLESISPTTPIDIQRVVADSNNIPVGVENIELVTASVTGRYRYTVTAIGNNAIAAGNPNRAVARAIETGVVSLALNLDIARPGFFYRAFSQYGTFVSRFPASSVWAGGVFQGKVHTNERLRYGSSSPVTFKGEVTQVGTTYDRDSSTYNVSSVQPNSTPHTGMTFNSSYKTVPRVDPPANLYAQKLAVLNSTGRADATFTAPPGSIDPTAPPDPTVTQMKGILRGANNAPPPTTGSGSSEVISNGVYLPANAAGAIAGGGIYVKGNVDEIGLTKGLNGAQVYAIRQGTTTTTVTITPPTGSSAGTTRIVSPAGTTEFQGVPIDRTNPVSAEQRPGVALFVDGSINNLHGPAISGGTVASAIAKDTALTIVSTGNITVTGSITYQEPKLAADGSEIIYPNNYMPQNVFGLVTNSGKIIWSPNLTYTTVNMTVDVALLAFDEAALTANPSANTGGLEVTNCSTCNSSTTMNLRGSRTGSKALTVSVNGSKLNRFFDPRFADGQFAPPFFPVARLSNTVGTLEISSRTSEVMTIANTWQRTYN